MSINVKILGLKDNHSVEPVVEQVALHYKRDTPEFKDNLKAAIANPKLAKPLLQNLDQVAADQACQILEGFGLVCEAQEEEEFSIAFETIEEHHRCPACNHEQPKDENGADVCVECGVVASKYSESSQQKIYAEEKQKLANQQLRNTREKEQQQAVLEEENIRDNVRAQLGLQNKSKKSRPMMALSIVAIAAVAGLVATQTEFGQSLLSAKDTTQAAVETAEPAGKARVTMATLQAIASKAAQQGGVKPVSDAQRVAAIEALVNSGNAVIDTKLNQQQPSNLSNTVSVETYTQAFSNAKEITDPTQKLTAIQAIASSATSQTHTDASLALFEKEFRGYSYAGTEKLGHQIIRAWLKREDVDHAYQAALQFRAPYQKSEALRNIVRWQVANLDKPEFSLALESLQQTRSNVKETQNRAQILSTISYIYKVIGKENQSEKYLDLAFNQSDLTLRVDDKITALSRIGEDRLALNDTELGLHIFENIKTMATGLSKYNPAKARSFRTIAISLAKSGNFLDAQQSIGEILDAEIRQDALIEVAHIATEADKLEIAAILLDTSAKTVLVGSN